MSYPVLLDEAEAFGAFPLLGSSLAVNDHWMCSIAPPVIDPPFFPSFGRPCNRLGIESSPSPFLKMSFETATHFLTDATLQGQTDHLESPSARIVVGRVVDVGTGVFDLVQNVSIKPKVKAPAALAK